MKKLFATLFMCTAIAAVFAQSAKEKGLNAITESAIKGQMNFLASDWTEGRGVGTRGAYMAAYYISSVFEIYGIEPFGDIERTQPTRAERMNGVRPEVYQSYYQNFGLIQYAPGDEQLFTLIEKVDKSQSAIEFKHKTDFYVQTGSVGLSAEASLVFAGYGFQDEDEKYNDLKKLDLEGKIAVVLEGYPGHRDTSSEGYEKFKPEGRYARYYMERDKATCLKDAGAIAIIHVTPQTDRSVMWAKNNVYPVKGSYYEADERLTSYYDFKMTLPEDTLELDLPVFMVTPKVANEIIKNTPINFDEFEEKVAAEMEPASRELEGKFVSFKTTVNSEMIKARNVLGYIEGKKKDEYIVVGGHYDHVGKWNGWICNGADDNASGTVGVMTIAKDFKAKGEKPEKSIIFAAWSGEEKGLWGSKYFVQQAKKQDMNVVLNLNYDMISRDTEKDTLKNQASMVYTKANSKIETITRKNLEEFDINLDLRYRPSGRPRGGSDHAPFAKVNIPVFYFMAAMHPDYHLPSDELSKINWEKMQNIIRIGFLNTWDFANSDEFLEVDDNLAEKEN
mgnify:FL=1